MEFCENTNSTLRNVQQKSLELLLIFDDFCKRNGLLYYVCGGCCIGAIRHKGFIPWDDDVDVMMPRDDFTRLSVLWQNQMVHTQYKFVDNSKSQYLRTMWASVSDENTTFIKERQADLDIPHGIRLEIIPLDGCPNSRLARKEQIVWALIHQIFIMQEPPSSKGKVFGLVGKTMLTMFQSWEKRYRLAKYAEKKMSRYSFWESKKVTELTTRYRYMLNEYPQNAFANAVDVEFEGCTIPVPQGYDIYLKMAFGSYMDLPPEKERMPRHDAVHIDINNSYTKYKGIYYCASAKE